MARHRKHMRKWRATVSVYDVHKSHHRAPSHDSADVFRGVLDEWVSAYAEQMLFKESQLSIFNIDWKCITCKTSTKINVKQLVKHGSQIDRRAFYCNKCRPKKFTAAIAADPILYRYMCSFYSKVRKQVKSNSNITELL